MVFEEILQEEYLDKTKHITQIRLDLEQERELALQRIIKAYTIRIRKISRTKILKIAIDNLIKDVEEQASEEEGLEFLRNLYKEAEF